MENQQQLIPEAQAALAVRTEPSVGQMLQAFIDRGITQENVTAFKEIVTLRREEIAFQNKKAFNGAFFLLKKRIAAMDFYADKAAKDRSGNEMYRFCSEQELSSKLDPVLLDHGFTMRFSQRQEGERVVAVVTLVHEEGHEEVSEYAVRMGSTNAAKDATQADTGSTTSAWRHLVMKLFGLKSRISENGDARNEGELINADEVQYLTESLAEIGGSPAWFWEMAGCAKVEDIRKGSYPVLVRTLELKRRKGK